MAEMVHKFVKETPKRFHSKPADQDQFVPIPLAFPLKNTVPMSPELETAKRARPLPEQQQQEFPQFKAAPLNPIVFESHGDYGVPRVEKKSVTVPEEFHFHEMHSTRVCFVMDRGTEWN